MSQFQKPLRQGLWKPRFSIRHDAAITIAELDSLRQRLQSANRLLNRVASILQQVRQRSPLSQNTIDVACFDVVEKLQSIREQISERLQLLSREIGDSCDSNHVFELKKLIKEVDGALAGCCLNLDQR